MCTHSSLIRIDSLIPVLHLEPVGSPPRLSPLLATALEEAMLSKSFGVISCNIHTVSDTCERYLMVAKETQYATLIHFPTGR